MEVQELRKLVSDGKVFRVDFVKRSDGCVRRMIARTGVHSGLTGTGPVYDAERHNLLTVFDMQKKAYRSIPADSILSLREHGRERHFPVVKGAVLR